MTSSFLTKNFKVDSFITPGQYYFRNHHKLYLVFPVIQL